MNTLPGKFISFSSHYTTSCCDLKYSPSLVTVCCKWRNFMTSTHLPRLVSRGNREFICRVNDTETEPDSNNDKEGVHEDGEVPHSTDLDGPVVDKNKDETKVTQTLKALNSLRVDENKAPVELEDREETLKAETKVTQTLKALNSLRVDENKAPVELEDREEVKVQSGSPLPGVEPQELDATIRIPKEIIEVLRNEVFGFDSFFVTSQEPYEGGVLFKGNLRGQAAQSYEKLAKRLQDKLGDKYKLFLLTNPEDDSPVAVVVPKNTLQPETTAVPEWFAAGAFGLVTVFTLLLRNVPALQSDVLSTFDNIELLKDGLPGAIVTALILGAHEIGHILVAKDAGVKLGIPYFIPSWQIGSFGAITRISNIVPKREDLLKVAAAGPIAGFSLGFVLLLLGFVLPPSDGLGVVVNASVFHESLLAGGIAKVILGDALKEGTAISVNPLVIWASAGLLINALSSIPAGEIDGGRISFAIWGRKVSSRVTAASIALLGFSSLFSDVAFYWVVLIFFLQRRTIAPLSEEITDPDNKYIALGISVLLLGLLVCLPYPFPFTPAEAVVDIL